MSAREVVVLGTSSQVPTRKRSHHSLAIRLDDLGFIVDPGEGTQRQMTIAGLRVSQVNAVLLTHFHGDHCLGLPGLVQRISLDAVEHEVQVAYPADGEVYWQRLRHASIFHDQAKTVARPVQSSGEVMRVGAWTVRAVALDHGVTCFGYRLDEDDAVALNGDKLAALGVRGRAVADLLRDGAVTVDGRVVMLGEVSIDRPGQSVAVVMDTRWCDAALELAAGVDLLVCESTYLEADAALAQAHGHMTASQAGRLAADAGARRLVLTHFSQRYPSIEPFFDEASRHHADVTAAVDGERVAVPDRGAWRRLSS